METKDSSFNPSDFIRFVEPDLTNSSPRATAFIVKLQPNIERRWRMHCDRYGLHRMRAMRDCFAAALRSRLEAEMTGAIERDGHARAQIPAGDRAAQPGPPQSLQDHWRQIEAGSDGDRAAADAPEDRFGF